jgi:MFS family permease
LGFVLLVPVLVVFQFVTDDSLNSQVLFFVLLCVAGVSFTAQLVALMVEVSEPVERKEQECPGIFGEKGAVAQAYALHNMAWACGQLVGPILAGGLAETAGWTVMVIVLAAISGATAILLAGTNEKVSGLLWKKPGPAREETGAN